MPSNKPKTSAKPKADFYAVVTRNQTINYYTAKELWDFINQPNKLEGLKTQYIILKSFPKPPHPGCPFTSYKNDGTPVWPYNGIFVMKNGIEVWAPDPVVSKVEVEVKVYGVDGYKPEKPKAVKTAKK